MEEDKRCAIRWKIALPVRYRGLSRQSEGSCCTQDLSTVGARLAMVERYRPGEQLSMILDIPGTQSGPMCVEADVVWQREVCEASEECNYMTGVVFRKVYDCHKKSILEYVSATFPEQFREKWWKGVR